MQPGDYSSYYPYPHNPNPNPNSNPVPAPPNFPYQQTSTPPAPQPPSYASAPPFAANYGPTSDYPGSYPPSSYSSYPQNPDPVPTAPSFNNPPPPPPPPPQQPQTSTPFPQFETHGTYQPQPPPPAQPYYSPYDHHQQAPPPQPNSISKSAYSSAYPSQFNQLSSPVPPVYDSPYDNNPKFDQPGSYLDDFSGRYGGSGRERSDFGSDFYGKMGDGGGYGIDGYGDGVYAYQGSKVEPYGARGTAPKSSTWSGFDDFGRPIGYSSDKERSSSGGSGMKVVRAVPKADSQQDVKGGVQKFRVKLLAESGGQSTMDVLCQIGLDGIRMLDPNTIRTLRIYPLDTITRCDKTDSSTLSFWSKSSVDIEPRRIRLQSNSYTTNTLLDTVTAATVQFKEMGGRSRPTESSRLTEQPPEKKKGLADWMTFMKPVNEEKDHWIPDEAVTKCIGCGADFNAFVRKHHCRNCGDIFCDKCTHGRIALTADQNAPVVRVCDRCMAEVSNRLNNAKEAVSRSTALQSHEDLAKKLQEEMEKNRKASSSSRSDGSGKRMKEVACPTCTVHLQVQVPSSGSETIECGVCQHPFLLKVGARAGVVVDVIMSIRSLVLINHSNLAAFRGVLTSYNPFGSKFYIVLMTMNQVKQSWHHAINNSILLLSDKAYADVKKSRQKFILTHWTHVQENVAYDLIVYDVIGEAVVKLPDNETIPAVFAFGDSIVDQGNNNNLSTLIKCNFPPYGKDFSGGIPTGRFSNSKTPPDLIAEELGIKEIVPAYLDPNLQANDLPTGVSFASGGSGYDPQTPQLVSVISLAQQLEHFKEYIGKLKGLVGEEKANYTLSNAIFLIVAGSDDIANTYFTIGIRKFEYDVNSYADLLVASASNFLQDLYKLGARKMAVFNVPPIGCVPFQRTLAGGALRVCADNMNQAAQLVNGKLSAVIDSLSKNYTLGKIIYIEVYKPLLDIIQNPQNYGFQVVDSGCCGMGHIEAAFLCNKYSNTCEDDSNHLFWDSYHPTQKGYTILVQDIIQNYVQRFF
ncbi:hypothetical protein ACH5RR_027511 [Cinchona calisaya]|uniref:FYVE-type domain-containing protein n=1 Tax=Cinchona calisaya TaxID=153742 RepID=A0ABD2Z7G6_9GENT